MTTNSTWAALRNPTFRKLWIAAVISGTCVAAHDSAATWMMNLVFSPHAWGWPPSSQAALCFMAFGENGESNFNSHNRDDANVLENMSDSLKP